MNNQIETLFTTALGLQPPWHVTRVELDTGKRLLFATPGRDHSTLQAFAQDLRAHGGDPERIKVDPAVKTEKYRV